MYTAWGKMPEYPAGQLLNTFRKKQTWQPSEHVSNIFEVSSKKNSKNTEFMRDDTNSTILYPIFWKRCSVSVFFPTSESIWTLFPIFYCSLNQKKRWNVALVDSKPLLEWPELKAREFYFFGPWHQMPRSFGVRSVNAGMDGCDRLVW